MTMTTTKTKPKSKTKTKPKTKTRGKSRTTPKTKLRFVISPNLRLPAGTADPERKKQALIAWVSNPKFADRRPTPDELVAECRKKTSPLYGLIETNPKKAAGIYWRQVAQYYLRHINVVRINVVTNEPMGQPVVAFLPVEMGRDGHIPEENYIPAGRVMEDEGMRQSVLERASGEMQAWIQRYERYAEFFDVFSPVLEAYQQVQKRLQSEATKGNGHPMRAK